MKSSVICTPDLLNLDSVSLVFYSLSDLWLVHTLWEFRCDKVSDLANWPYHDISPTQSYILYLLSKLFIKAPEYYETVIDPVTSFRKFD
jgi:hypothetical protein